MSERNKKSAVEEFQKALTEHITSSDQAKIKAAVIKAENDAAILARSAETQKMLETEFGDIVRIINSAVIKIHVRDEHPQMFSFTDKGLFLTSYFDNRDQGTNACWAPSHELHIRITDGRDAFICKNLRPLGTEKVFNFDGNDNTAAKAAVIAEMIGWVKNEYPMALNEAFLLSEKKIRKNNSPKNQF